MRLRAFGGLWVEHTRSGTAAGPRPRPLALLAILAVAGARGVSRERALGILWPESEPERARHALSQTIYSLRRDLQAEVVRSTPDLHLDPAQITSDVEAFQAAVASKSWAEAAALYVGPFLDGFYLADAPEFERWAEERRATFAVDGLRAIETLATEHTRAGRLREACPLLHRLTRLDPVSARFAGIYMECLASLGDRSAALAHGKAHAELLRREFDAEPDGELEALMARLRDAPARAVHVQTGDHGLTGEHGLTGAHLLADQHIVSSEPTETAGAPTIDLAPQPARRRSVRFRTAGLAVAVVAATAGALGWRALAAARATAQPVLAVGLIRDLVVPDSARLSGVLSEMLATSLARLPDLHVIANSRMLELTPRDVPPTRAALSDAARRAGATELIEGELIPLAQQTQRLDVRRVEIASGRVRGGYRIVGADRIRLFDSATTLIGLDLRIGPPEGSLAEASTASPIAYRLYEEGLRAFHQFDIFAANRLFRAAIAEDSSFAMAVYYAWRSATLVGDSARFPLADRAVAWAGRASERDRLLIRTHVGHARDDRAALAAAESLAARHPHDPDALIRAAEVIPDLGRAIALLNRAIALDSAAALSPAAVCRLCDAFSLLVRHYQWADSSAGVERSLARWMAMRPDDAMPWRLRADHLIGMGRRGDAEEAERRYESMGGTPRDAAERRLVWSLRSDDYDVANAECDAGLASRDTVRYLRYRRHCALALRAQGRYREALALVREGRAPRSGATRGDVPPDPLHAALLDLEMGRPRVAANDLATMGAAAHAARGSWGGEPTRRPAWLLTLAATAAVTAGDTIRARALADSVAVAGRASAAGQDPVLHRFVHGLLFSRAGQHVAAVREFRAALDAPGPGLSRINYELGQSLLALGRPAEGIPMVRAILQAGSDGVDVHLSRTEAHELLAQLFAAAVRPDSAAAHYAVVARAWAGADPALRGRAATARGWLAHARHEER